MKFRIHDGSWRYPHFHFLVIAHGIFHGILGWCQPCANDPRFKCMPISVLVSVVSKNSMRKDKWLLDRSASNRFNGESWCLWCPNNPWKRRMAVPVLSLGLQRIIIWYSIQDEVSKSWSLIKWYSETRPGILLACYCTTAPPIFWDKSWQPCWLIPPHVFWGKTTTW